MTEDGALVRDTSVWDRVIVPFTGKGIAKGVLDHRIGEYARKLAQIPIR